jgi:hypothetical protein
MQTYRITVSSVLVATMSMCACLLLAETPAFAQSASASRAQSARFTESNQHTPDAQSKRHAAGRQQPLEKLAYEVLSASSSEREISAKFSLPGETFRALLSRYLSSN